MVGFELIERGIPRNGHPILNAEGKIIGRVTSGTQSPSLEKAIGLGYVPRDLAGEGLSFLIQVRNKQVPAKVVPYPSTAKENNCILKRILILGASGFIGQALYKELSPYYATFGTYHSIKNTEKQTVLSV